MFHFLGYRNLFHSNSIKAASAAAARIQSFQYPFLVRGCHQSQQPHSSLIQYLEASLDFSPERALKVSKELRRNIKNPELVPTFLKSNGFSKAHIKSIIDRHPRILRFSFPESGLAPKIHFFKEKGLSDSDIMKLMVTNPYLFSRSLERSIKPFFDLTLSILGREEFVVEIFSRSRLCITLDAWTTNVTLLRSCGVNDHRISKMIRTHPQVFAARPDRLNEAVEMVKGMGFNPSLNIFMEAVHTIMCLSRLSWQMRFKVFRSVGWSDEEIQSAFRKKPNFFRLSEEKIKKAMDYFTKELGWDPSYISTNPKILCLSLEKRIIPRHQFLQFLASNGCIKKDKIFLNSFFMAERKFLDECVLRYQSRVPDVLQIYEDLLA